MNIRRLPFFVFAVAIGASMFGLLWLPKAKAAGVVGYCSGGSGNATMCYEGSTYYNVPPIVQNAYHANGGGCGACGTSPDL